jgi:hypothetical protein
MCGTMEVHNRLLEEYPECRARRAEISAALEATLSENPSFRRTCGLTTIPVVVHVVYNNDTENISHDQVTSQIEALNRDYRGSNSDIGNVPDVWKSLAQDPMIEFALATTDPDGNATDGITRTKTDQISFRQDDSVKSAARGGVDPWPSDKYLNIWVCTLSGGLLGYAQFPGMPPDTDGVVILNTAFGTTGSVTAPFNMGRTTVHEVGHWLDLKHIWRDTNNCGGTDCRRYAKRAAAQFRKADVSSCYMFQPPGRRYVRKLHGLRRRRYDDHVYLRPNLPDARHIGRFSEFDRKLSYGTGN